MSETIRISPAIARMPRIQPPIAERWVVVVSTFAFSLAGASPEAAGGGGGGAMLPVSEPVVAAAPGADVSVPDGVPFELVVDPAVVPEPLAGGGAALDSAALGALSCRRDFDVFAAVFEVVVFEVVVLDEAAARAGGVRVGDGLVPGVVTSGVVCIGVVCIAVACPLGGAWPVVASVDGAIVGTSGMGVAAGAGADDASGVGSGLCACVIAAPARKTPAIASDRQRFRIVSSFSLSLRRADWRRGFRSLVAANTALRSALLARKEQDPCHPRGRKRRNVLRRTGFLPGMSAAVRDSPPMSLSSRLARVDWSDAAASLDACGYARLPGLLTEAECRKVSELWESASRFRAHVDMERHRFGVGSYRYFAAPLPKLIATLRRAAYAGLAPLANSWAEALGEKRRYPAKLEGFLRICRDAGQTRPTPLLLRYGTGGYNCLHRDLYGEVAFPLQLAVFLSRPGRDYDGGAFLLVEQHPRQQSRGEALLPEAGEGIVFASADRPAAGRRGRYRARMRHGVATITRGERFTLGIVFHDAA